MAIAIRTYGESHQLHEDYQQHEVESRILEAIKDGKPAITFRGPGGRMMVFSIGGTAPLVLEDYDPEIIQFS